MDTKTIGGLIATLRKANGMTQKDLAEKLNVSDKTVSRWERAEGTPDLALIPVIAEIFGVTCDELLRGERRPPEERVVISSKSEMTQKGEKQLQRLLKATYSQYQMQSYVAMGISAVGLIVALICNLAFLKAVLGFLLGTIFFVISVVCQAVFLNRAFLSVEDAGLSLNDLSRFKRNGIRLAQRSVGLTAALAGFTAPMLMADAYVGLSMDSMLILGAIGAAVLLLVYLIVCYFLNAALLKKGVYSLEEREREVYNQNHRLKKRCAAVLVLLLAVTFVGHQAATTIWGAPWSIMNKTTFYDYESFIAFMEQDVPQQDFVSGSIASAPSSEVTYYDAFGNEISEEEAIRSTLTDENGNVVCEYIRRNWNVCSIRYSTQEGSVLPISVSTYDDLQEAQEKAAVRHVIFGAAYCVEAGAILMVYFKKRAT